MGATVAPVILATDKTQLTQFSGNRLAYPVYMTLGNIPRSIRRKPSQHACVLVAYLSVNKSVGQELTQKEKSARIQQIFHDSLRVVLEPLKKAGKEGMEVTFGDGYVRRVHPILACYVADYPEQCLVTCCKYGTCPKCDLGEDQIGNREGGNWRTQRDTLTTIKKAAASATSTTAFQLRCRQDHISGAVTRPFWDGFPLYDIHLSITPDVLHQLYQGIVKYLVLWCTCLMEVKELDERIKALPPCFGVRHFKKGWSELSQVSGGERKNMARILLACIVGRVPSKAVICFRALLDFIYIAQYASHDDDTLQYLEDALDLYHQNKDVLTDEGLGLRTHLNIPKFHAMVHYSQSIRAFGTTDNYNTEMFERFHIDFAKEGWRASNFRNELPQMTRWLERQEKVASFETYIDHFKGEQDNAVTAAADIDDSPPRILVPAKPDRINQTLISIQTLHHCPSFSHQLRVYLNSLLDQSDALPRANISSAYLPFDKVNVWHSFKFGRSVLGNDIEGTEEKDWVRAKPARQGGGERFDTVVVSHTQEAENTGMKGKCYFLLLQGLYLLGRVGMKVGRLRVIFTLPEIIRNWYAAPRVWSTGHLAYVEWYKVSNHPGAHHNMYTVHRPLVATASDRVVEGEIVPLRSIRQTCQLVPLTGPNIPWPKSWNTNNVLDESQFFLLNNWSSKYAYQTIW